MERACLAKFMRDSETAPSEQRGFQPAVGCVGVSLANKQPASVTLFASIRPLLC